MFPSLSISRLFQHKRFPILFILAVGFLLRLVMLLSEKSLWGDEWYSIKLAHMSVSEMVYTTTVKSNHPPLYLWILNIAAHIFGQREWVYRGLSMVANTSIIFAVYGIADELFKRKTALLAALFVAVSPYFLQLANEVRSYSVLTAFTSFATYFLIKALNQPKIATWRWCYMVLAIFAVYAEHYGWLWLFGITMFLGYLVLTDWKKNKAWLRRQCLVFFLGSVSLVLIAFQSVMNEGIFQAERLAPYRSLTTLLKKGIGIFWHLVCGPVFSMIPLDRVMYFLKTSPIFWLSFLVTLICFVVVVRALFHLFQSRRELFALFFTIIFVPMMGLLLFYPIRLSSRYVCWSAPFFMIMLSQGMLMLKSVSVRTGFLILFFATALYGNIYLIQLKTDAVHKEDYRGMVQYAFENAGPEVAICGLGSASTFYAEELNIQPKGAFYKMSDDLVAARPKGLKEAWVMVYINMNPEETAVGALLRADRKMATLGLVRSGELIRFGGPDALTALQVYRKSKQ